MNAPVISRPAPDREEQVERGLLVELAARLGDQRRVRGRPAPDLDTFAQIAAAAPVAEVVRMRNRLRDVADEEARHPGRPHPARVPGAEPVEVWDAPVRVWSWQGTVHHITAVSVAPRLYLETFHGGAEVPRDQFGAQVIACAATPGEPDVYGVFWRFGSWRQATGELSEAELVGWTGTPLPAHRMGYVARDMERWLDTVVTQTGES